jgi:hypothetical protein
MHALLEHWYVPTYFADWGSRNLYKLGGLLLAITLNAIAWVLIAMAVCYVLGISASPLFLLGVGLTIAPLSGVVLAAVLAAR